MALPGCRPVDVPVSLTARFDDLGQGGRSFILAEPVAVFAAHTVDQVAEAIGAAEDAARCGRWVAGFVTYEAAPAFDPALPALAWPDRHPLAALPLVWFAAFARHTNVRPDRAVPTRAHAGWRLDRDRVWHRDAVARVRDAIAAGDYYQLNLTTRLHTKASVVEPLYAALAAAQAGRYNALITTPRHTVASASPELFFERAGDHVRTRPMKGTAGRGCSGADDRSRIHALRRSPKERAENTMIVDLLRNDLGRVAVPGTVTVPALFEVETYPTVHQLTSTVTARVEPGTGLFDLFASLFPCGSVTGAPKRAAMLGIAALEASPRGAYCGAVGYLRPGPRPDARFSVGIRTVTWDRRSGYAEYGTGGGITFPSDPDAEWAELITKAAILNSVGGLDDHAACPSAPPEVASVV